MPASYAPLLDAVRGLHWAARRASSSSVTGAHHSRLHGSSPEVTEYRAYRPGDEARRVDWKLLARSDRAFVRLATDRATLATLFVVDASASMAFPVATLGKWAMARQLVVGLAAVALGEGDPVGLAITGDDDAPPLAPRSRRGVVAEVVRRLHAVTPRGSDPLEPLVAAGRRIPRLVIVSDFLGDGDAARAAARTHVARGGEVHAVHVVAREELAPSARALLAEDPETPEVRRPLVAATRDAYVEAFREWRMMLAREWRAAGASYTLAVDDEPAARIVRRVAAGAGAAGAGSAPGDVRAAEDA